MKNFNLRQCFSCAKTEYIKWVCDARMVILGVLLIFIYNFAIQPLLQNAEKMNEPLNMLEPFIAVANSGAVLMIIPLVFMTLIADFPKIDNNTVFYIMRIGRKNWLTGQIIKLVMMAASYLAVIFVGSVVPMLTRGFWYNGWSNVVTNFKNVFPEQSMNFGTQLVPENLYNQLTVFEAAVKSYLLVFAYLMIIGLILLALSLIKHKTLGFVSCGAVIALGTAFCSIKTVADVDDADGEQHHLAALYKVFQSARGVDSFLGDLPCDIRACADSFLLHNDRQIQLRQRVGNSIIGGIYGQHNYS